MAILGATFAPGCATVTQGNFLPDKHENDVQEQLAEDSALALAQEHGHEEAQRFRLAHEAPDPFGTHLADTLRGAGHHVASHGAAPSGGEHQVSYVVDEIQGTKLLRVLLTVDDVELTRAYAQSGAPAGPWSRKEGRAP